jgi:hypothetical protein
MKRNESVAGTNNIPQVPGCLPQGYDENSLLTVEQFARWKQISVRTARDRLAMTPGLIRHSSRDQRIHVKTHLARVLKSK